MLPGTTGLPVRLLAVVLLLIPGVVAVQVYYRRTRQTSSLTRLQWTVYSAFISTLSMIVLYVLSPVYFDPVTGTTDDVASSLGLVTRTDLLGSTISDAVVLYVFHFLLTGTIAYAAGWWVERRADEARDRREPWHYAFSVLPQEGEEIEVVTTFGTVVRGDFNRKAWDDAERELLLDDPREVRYDRSGDAIVSSTSLGRRALLTTDSISEVRFPETDPESEAGREADGEGGRNPQDHRIDVLNRQFDDLRDEAPDDENS